MDLLAVTVEQDGHPITTPFTLCRACASKPTGDPMLTIVVLGIPHARACEWCARTPQSKEPLCEYCGLPKSECDYDNLDDPSEDEREWMSYKHTGCPQYWA